MIPEDLCPQGGLDYEEAKRIAAVIEAAKALVDPDQCRGWFSLYTRLERAVEALQEAEGE